MTPQELVAWRRKERMAYNRGLWTGAGIIGCGILLGALVFAAEVESVRQTQYDWQCEDDAGNLLSGHTRQDKAFQSCMNRALVDGQTYIVRGGVYRVTADPGELPPTEPPPEPPPDESPQVTFGPVTGILQYDSAIGALAQDQVRWELTFTLNTVDGIRGLVSRDESGTTAPGHLTVWVENGVLTVRHQDGGAGVDGVQFLLQATTPIVAGTEYVAVVSINKDVGTGLWLDGNLEASSSSSYGLAGNSLPLTLGGRCSRCDDAAVPPVGPHDPIDGTVYMEIYDAPLELPSGSVTLNWTLPTEYEDGTPLPTGVPTAISVYQLEPRLEIARLDGEATSYEVTGLMLQQQCFVATAWDATVESRDSGVACKQPVP